MYQIHYVNQVNRDPNVPGIPANFRLQPAQRVLGIYAWRFMDSTGKTIELPTNSGA